MPYWVTLGTPLMSLYEEYMYLYEICFVAVLLILVKANRKCPKHLHNTLYAKRTSLTTQKVTLGTILYHVIQSTFHNQSGTNSSFEHFFHAEKRLLSGKMKNELDRKELFNQL